MADKYLLSSQFVFGDGVTGSASISSTVNLSSNVRYTSLIVEPTGIINTRGAKIFATESIVIDGGAINDAGNNAVGDVGGAATTADNYFRGGGGGGSSPATGNPGNPGDDVATALGGNGGPGGLSPSFAGGALGTATAPSDEIWREVWHLLAGALYDKNVPGYQPFGGGGGGGSGASEDADSGGGGGGGGVIWIAAPFIQLNLSAVVAAYGGNGGNGVSVSGGGGGGGGGTIVLIYHKLVDDSGGGLLVLGGNGGDAAGAGAFGGFGGSGGRLIQVDLTSGDVIVTIGAAGTDGADG